MSILFLRQKYLCLFPLRNGYATFQRNKVWKSEETLWHDVVLKSPRNGRGLMNYANTLMVKCDFAGALDYYHRAQHLTPQNLQYAREMGEREPVSRRV